MYSQHPGLPQGPVSDARYIQAQFPYFPGYSSFPHYYSGTTSSPNVTSGSLSGVNTITTSAAARAPPPTYENSVPISTIFPSNQVSAGSHPPIFSTMQSTSAPSVVSHQSISSTIQSTSTTSTTTNSRRQSTKPNNSVIVNDESSSSRCSVVLTNACLSFIRSELYRKVEAEIIEAVSQFFSLDEIKQARKELFVHSENKQYMYRGVQGPATNKQKAAHCAASVIAKFRDLENVGPVIQISCLAEDLFRLNQICCSRYVSVEERLSNLEKEMCEVKASKSKQAVSESAPAFPPNRESLLSEVLKNQMTPNRRNMAPSKPRSESAKRNRSPNDETDWERVNHRRNGGPTKRLREESNNASVDTHKDLVGAEYHDVFLCNYRNIATAPVIKHHFKDKYKLSVISVRESTRPNSDVKSFIMRLRDKDDYLKAIKVLPFKTGARWFIPFPDPEKPRPPLHFNNTNASPDFLLNRPQDSEWPTWTPNRGSTPDPSVSVSPTHGGEIPGGGGSPNLVNLQIARLPTAESSSATAAASGAPSFVLGGPVSLETMGVGLVNSVVTSKVNNGA